jgi:hypothetical protein
MDAPANAVPTATQPGNRAFAGLAIGAICGAIVWAVVQSMHPIFAVPEQYHIAGLGAPVEKHEAFRQQQDIVDRRHLTLYLAMLALVLGAALGGWTGRTWRTAALAATQGMMGAIVAGSLAAIFYIGMRNRIGQGDLLYPFLRQLIVGLPLGAGIGSGLVMRSGRWSAIGRGLLAGAIGGVIYSAVYTLIVALGLPEANTESLLPEESLTRLVWLATLGGAVGAMASFAAARDPDSLDQS